jgi:hypothetical protein
MDGLASKREAELVVAKVDAAGAHGELKAHEEARSDAKEDAKR